MRPVTVGIELGDAGVRLVALDGTGNVVRERTMAVAPEADVRDMTVPDFLTLVRSVAADDPIDAVGIGASGLVDHHGVVAIGDRLAALRPDRLADLVSAEFGVPCVVENDAVTAAIGEYTSGAGKNVASLLMVTLGPVIGVGLLVDGHPVRGADGSHPEAGHLPVPGVSASCYCGLSACWEQVASRPALDYLTSGRTAELAARAQDGDMVAQTVFDLYGSRVAAGLAILLPLIRPARLVLAGSAAEYLPLFSAGLDASLRRAGPYSHSPEMVAAALGDVAGAIGAAVLARRAERPPARSAGGLHL
jgi:glucokinase